MPLTGVVGFEDVSQDHARRRAKIEPNPKIPIVGGAGLYAGATGLVEGHVLPSGVQLNIIRMQVP